MTGYVERLDAATLTAAGSSCAEGRSTNTCLEGTNDITARLANGLLWVTQVAGGNGRNYCADPSNGRPLTPIRLPSQPEDEVLAIAPRRIFYAVPGPQGKPVLAPGGHPRALPARADGTAAAMISCSPVPDRTAKHQPSRSLTRSRPSLMTSVDTARRSIHSQPSQAATPRLSALPRQTGHDSLDMIATPLAAV